jgi:hypothetical protein
MTATTTIHASNMLRKNTLLRKFIRFPPEINSFLQENSDFIPSIYIHDMLSPWIVVLAVVEMNRIESSFKATA